MKASLLSFLLPISTLLIFSQAERGGKGEASIDFQGNQKSIDELFLNSEGFFNEVGKEVKNEGFNNMTTGVISRDGIWVNIVIREGEPITEQMQEKARKISKELIKKYNLDPEFLIVEISH